jgi:zinc metalloprotease ZmpB
MKTILNLISGGVFLILLFWIVMSPVSPQAEVISRHKDRSTPQLLFQTGIGANTQLTAEQQAYAYLSEDYELFELPQDLSNLKLTQIQDSLLGKHFHFQQIINNIPVEYAEIIVSISNKDGGVYMVFNNTYPQRRPVTSVTAITHDEALDIAWKHLRVHGGLISVPSSELIYMPAGDNFRLIHRTQIYCLAPYGYWEHKIDAVTGEIISVRDTAITRKKTERESVNFEAYYGVISDRNATTSSFLGKQTALEQKILPSEAVTVNGTASVFDPDPRTTLMNDNLQDTDPAAAFTNAYLTRTLRDITNDNGTYSLDGPWVRIVDFEPANTPPSTTTDGNWTATRGNNAFNDVMTYFHIDQNQRYIQSLGFSNIVHYRIDADSDARQFCFGGSNDGNGCNTGADCPGGTCASEDNSCFCGGKLTFGHGGVDDNEDADVILHEYGHAIQASIGLGGGGDTGAIAEGFGDYWGGSYSYSTPNGPNYHPEWAFTWDAHNNYWGGRFMNKLTYQYDPHSTYPAHAWVNGADSDELWSTPLFQSFLELINLGRPRTEMDKIVLQSYFGLGSGATMPVLANAIVAAAQSLYPSGPHSLVYGKKFGDQNIIVTYVDGNWTGTENGSMDNPYNTITEGVSAVVAGARLSLKAGAYTGAGNVPITITKPMTLMSYGGIATIGP